MENQKLQTLRQEAGLTTDVTGWALPEGAIARLGRGMGAEITFSPDGNTLAVGNTLGVWLYDVATLMPIDLWDTERGMLSTVAFSPNGALLATGNWDGDIKVWEVHSQRCISQMKRTARFDRAFQLVFSRDGRYLASSGGRYDAIYVWHLDTGEQVATFTVDESRQPRYRPPRIPLSFSPDGKLLAGATPENTISIWDLEVDDCIACLTGHVATVTELIFSPCGQFLTSADRDGVLHQWDVSKVVSKPSSACYSVLPTDAIPFPKLAYLPDGTLVAAGRTEKMVIVWDANRGETLWILRREPCPYPACFSPQGSHLVLMTWDEIQMWELGEPSPRMSTNHEHTGVCGAVTFSPEGSTLAAAYWSGELKLRDVESLKCQTTIKCEGLKTIRSIDFSPCGNQLAATSYDKTLRVWELGKRDASPIELVGHQAVLYAAAFSPKGALLVSADAKGVLGVWDVQHGYECQMFTAKTDWIWSIAFSPDGMSLVSAHHGKNARVWDIESGEQVTELSLALPRDTTRYKGDPRGIQNFLKWLEKDFKQPASPKAVAFSPDGTVIAGGVFREIRLWDAATYETRMVLCQPHGCQRPEALTFSPCGRYLVSGASWQGTAQMSLRFWEVATGENIATFWGHSSDIQDLAFSPDGTLLASASYDGSILLWDMKPYL